MRRREKKEQKSMNTLDPLKKKIIKNSVKNFYEIKDLVERFGALNLSFVGGNLLIRLIGF